MTIPNVSTFSTRVDEIYSFHLRIAVMKSNLFKPLNVIKCVSHPRRSVPQLGQKKGVRGLPKSTLFFYNLKGVIKHKENNLYIL